MKHFPVIWKIVLLYLLFGSLPGMATKLASVQVVDKDYLMIHFLDGDVTHRDDGKGETAFLFAHDDLGDTVKTYGTALSTTNATSTASWSLSSTDDPSYNGGKAPTACCRQMKLNGMAEKPWSTSINDYVYEITNEHFIYLKLPSSMVQGKTYTLTINASTNTDVTTSTFKFDITQCRSEAIHVNLVGYSPDQSIKAADLYMWMGDGGARDYASFVGKKVYLYNLATSTSQEVGTVALWKTKATESQGYNLTQSSVWSADFSAFTQPGTYRLCIEDVGASQDFRIDPTIYKEPFQVNLKGFFYMRIGQDSTGGIRPVPRRPLYIPGKNPSNTTVYITTLQPYDANWATVFPSGSGDPWDNKTAWAAYKKSGNPTNNRAVGGHADAADWDRYLGHVCIVYDMLLPYILTNGAINDDNVGIAESGNGIPDIIDEARNEVDFWLHLRDGQGYSHGLNNPDDNNVFYQAGTNATAAWASAANAAMLADAFRITGKTDLMNEYRDSAVAAYTYAGGLSDQLLDKTLGEGESTFRGRDFKMTAAAFLYNVTGEASYEQTLNTESLCKSSDSADLDDHGTHNQLYATAAYLITPRTRNFPTLYNNMKASLIYQAKKKHVDMSNSRPSRRSSDDKTGWFQTVQEVQPAILAHFAADNDADRAAFRKAIVLEADWGLGRNPLNMIQMTTASTSLDSKRSVEEMFTSGRNDGTPGQHPGHTPYLNSDDWGGLTMGNPSWMTSKAYPDFSKWPKAECYFKTRYVYAHSEFTPQQTMRGKMAIYGYLYGLGKIEAQSRVINGGKMSGQASIKPSFFSLRENQLRLLMPGDYKMSILDLSGRTLWSQSHKVKSSKDLVMPAGGSGLRIISVQRNGVSISKAMVKVTE